MVVIASAATSMARARIRKAGERQGLRKAPDVRCLLATELTLLKRAGALTTAGQFRVVSHQYQSGLLFLIQPEEQVCNMVTVGKIQAASGFIGKQDGGGDRKGAGQSDPLRS